MNIFHNLPFNFCQALINCLTQMLFRPLFRAIGIFTFFTQILYILHFPAVTDPKVLIEGVLFRARYLGSTQLVINLISSTCHSLLPN